MFRRRQLLAMLGSIAAALEHRSAAAATLSDLADSVRIIRRFQAAGIAVHSYTIGTDSMLPGIANGDVLLADLRIAGKLPDRGDLIVFKRAHNIDWIKRVVGLPGDIVAFHNRFLVLNGDKVTGPTATSREFDTSGRRKSLTLYQETLPGAPPHQIAFEFAPDLPDVESPAETGQTVVAAGSLYVLGDFRDNSLDSRSSSFGPVGTGDVEGRVVYRLRPNAGWLVPPESVAGLPPP
jgi:signal peptidase I